MKLYASHHASSVNVPDDTIVIDLFPRDIVKGIGRVGGQVPQVIDRHRLSPSTRAWDFAAIALSVVAADETVNRSRSADGWTRQIELTVSVSEPEFWKTQTAKIESLLGFLTGDIWSLHVASGGYVHNENGKSRPASESLVCLLSGGMDSLIGAIDSVRGGENPLFVSQSAKGNKKDQQSFAQNLSPDTIHLQLNHNARPVSQSERSQRSRSMAFIAFGVLAGTSLEAAMEGQSVNLLIPENGFISQNVPLTPLRTGSLSTRTTHPFYLKSIQDILTHAGIPVHIKNPYEHLTKGEMLLGCVDQVALTKLVWQSTSCGRFARNNQHCGRCVPCQVRRAAVIKWGKPDRTATTPKKGSPRYGYKYHNIGDQDADHAWYDDVRSVAIALNQIRDVGVKAWAGGAINASMLDGNSAPYLSVVERGMQELDILHEAYHVL